MTEAFRPSGRVRAAAARGIYVARADFHLMVEKGIVRVTKGPPAGPITAGNRSSVPAAHNYGQKAIGGVLTGNLDDDTSGL